MFDQSEQALFFKPQMECEILKLLSTQPVFLILWLVTSSRLLRVVPGISLDLIQQPLFVRPMASRGCRLANGDLQMQPVWRPGYVRPAPGIQTFTN